MPNHSSTAPKRPVGRPVGSVKPDRTVHMTVWVPPDLKAWLSQQPAGTARKILEQAKASQ
jgi:hypothetical protein